MNTKPSLTDGEASKRIIELLRDLKTAYQIQNIRLEGLLWQLGRRSR